MAYLDAAGGRRPDPRAIDATMIAFADGFADARARHGAGRRARALLDTAVDMLARDLGSRRDDLTVLPGHRAAVQWALTGCIDAGTRVGDPVLLVAGAAEHSHVLHALESAADAGVMTHTVPVDHHARVDPTVVADVLASAPEARSIVVLQTANQEVGTRQRVEAVAQACTAANAVLVLDASVTAPWEPLPDAGDVIIVDAAAWGGPRSVAAAIVRSRRVLRSPSTPAPIEPPAVPEVVMAATALHLARTTADDDAARVSALVDRIRHEASTNLEHLEVLGDPVDRVPHLLTLSLMYVAGEAVVDALGRRGVMVGSGSACTSDTLEPSHVLAAMGALTHGNLRLGLEPATTDDDVALLLSALPEAVAEVRAGLEDLL